MVTAFETQVTLVKIQTKYRSTKYRIASFSNKLGGGGGGEEHCTMQQTRAKNDPSFLQQSWIKFFQPINELLRGIGLLVTIRANQNAISEAAK